MIRHGMMAKFRADAPRDKINRFLVTARKPPYLGREMRDDSHGKCVSTRYHRGDFDFAGCCDIDSCEAMNRDTRMTIRRSPMGLRCGQQNMRATMMLAEVGFEFDGEIIDSV